MKRESWSWEKDHGFDEKGYQRKKACLAVASCPKCGEEVGMVADTHAWRKGDDGRWHHAEYGPSVGWCCGLAIIDEFDGCVVLDLNHHHGQEVECHGCEDCDGQEFDPMEDDDE